MVGVFPHPLTPCIAPRLRLPQAIGSGCLGLMDGPTSSTGAILSHSAINKNEGGMIAGGGGGLYMGPYTYLTISFTSFTGNRAKRGGAIMTMPSARLTIRHCMFADNRAYVVGGAIASELATLTIISTQFVLKTLRPASGLHFTSTSQLRYRSSIQPSLHTWAVR
jgi:predicted outer membrane repeat protein